MRQHTDRKPSAGFTLTELLIAITVIAILAGMAIPAIMRSVMAARETAVVVEISQLDMAIEQFKTTYGFYPPCFETDVTTFEELMPYVTGMSPNHAEQSDSGVPGGAYLSSGNRMRLEHWYIEVGQYLDKESSLVFWLSGVCKNKQYPITGAGSVMVAGTPPLAAHGFNFDVDGIERDIIYEFSASQLVGAPGSDPTDPNQRVFYDQYVAPLPTPPTLTELPANVVGYVVEYRQAHAGDDGEEYVVPGSVLEAFTDYRYKYRNAGSYLGIQAGAGSDSAYYDASGAYANPKRFQIVSFGMDGLSGIPGDWNDILLGTKTISATYFFWGRNAFFGDWGADNITNFANGRLEKYVVENEN